MSESLVHIDHVTNLEMFVRELTIGRSDLVIYKHAATASRDQIPPIINGCRPDLYARLWKTDDFFIGEAKTTTDLRTERTKSQLSVFIREIEDNPKGRLILCAPFEAQAAARALLWELAAHIVHTREIYSIFPGIAGLHEARLGAT